MKIWENGVVRDATEQEIADMEAMKQASLNEDLTNPNGPIRQERNFLLSQSDWVVIASIEGGSPIPAEWAAYRQALRDIPSQEGFPQNIIWPTKPE